MKKVCRRCLDPKDLDDFHRNPKRKDGRRSYCKECEKTAVYARREANPDKAKENCRRFYTRHRDQQQERMRRYRQENPGAAYAAVKKWRDNNPGMARVMNRKREETLEKVEGRFTAKQWKEKCAAYDHCCAYCRKKVKLTVHHVVALSKGGTNYIKDVVPACQSCNSSIGTKTVWPEEVCHH